MTQIDILHLGFGRKGKAQLLQNAKNAAIRVKIGQNKARLQ